MKKINLLSLQIVMMLLMVNNIMAQENNSGKCVLKSNLPIVIIDTDNQLNAEEKLPAVMKVIYSDGKKQYSSEEKDYSYNGAIGIKLRGNSSLSFNQKKFTLETRDENGKSKDVSLMGMPKEHDWVLLAPYADVSMMRDALAFRLWREMGYWAPRTVMCEVIYNGKYAGVYTLSESIKKGKDRMNIDTLKPEDISGNEITGGYLLRIDTHNDKDATFTSDVAGIGKGLFDSQIVWTCLYPKKKNIKPEQLNYIKDFIDEMELCVASADYADPNKGYTKYINVESFVDYFIHTELSENADGYKRSAYFYKTKQNADGTGGKLYAGTVWDYNLAYGCCSFCNADDINSWVYEGCNTNPTPAFWKRLIQDPVFFNKVKARYAELRKSTLNKKNIYAIIDGYANQLSIAQKRHFDTFPELLGKETKRNSSGQGMMNGFANMGGMAQGMSGFGGQTPQGGFPQIPTFGATNFGGGTSGTGDMSNMGGMMLSWFRSYTVKSYDDEIKMLKEWISNRLAVLDEKLNYL